MTTPLTILKGNTPATIYERISGPLITGMFKKNVYAGSKTK